MANTDCPKCDSKDVLVGTDEQPNHCADCDYEWYPDEVHRKPTKKSVGPKVKKEDTLVFKSPEVLLSINQNFRQKGGSLARKLNKALDESTSL